MMAKAPVKKSNKIEDMRVKSDDQLSGDLAELKREAFNLRFQAATNQLERPARIREVRRDIAHIKTLQSQRSGKPDLGQTQRTSAAVKA